MSLSLINIYGSPDSRYSVGIVQNYCVVPLGVALSIALSLTFLNFTGNLLVPNDNYCKFEDWIIPIFDEMLKEQNTQVITESNKVIYRTSRVSRSRRAISKLKH